MIFRIIQFLSKAFINKFILRNRNALFGGIRNNIGGRIKPSLIMKKLLVISLIALSFQVLGQNDDFAHKLLWKINGVSKTDSSTDQFSSSSEFVTQGTNTITWIQKGGSVVYNFEVTQKAGNWRDSKQDGELVFSVLFRGHAGKIKFSRKEGRITIEPHIPIEGKNTLPFVFTIVSITAI